MKNKKWLIVLAATASISMADVSLNFTVAPELTGIDGRVDASVVPLVFNFSIDGSGNVSLDVESLSPESYVRHTINGWDSTSVGTVTEPSLFNTTFQLTASGGGARILLDGANGGGIGMNGGGGNSGRIDATEKLTWSVTSGDVVLKIKRFDYANGASGTRTDIQIANGDYSNSWYDLSRLGTRNLSADGVVVKSGCDLVFRVPDDYTNGYSLSGFSFEVLSAVKGR